MALKQTISVLAISTLTVLGANLALAQTPGDCVRYQLSGERPSWISSALFDRDGGRVLIVDPSRAEVMVYSPTGKSMGQVWTDSSQRILELNQGESGFIAKLPGSEGLFLKPDFKVAKVTNFRTTRTGAPSGVGSIYDFVLVDHRMFGYGSVREAPSDPTDVRVQLRGFQLGFFEASLGGSARLIHPLEQNSYYLLGLPYVATDRKSAAYFLEMKEKDSPILYEADFAAGEDHHVALRRIALPEELRDPLPVLPESNGPEDTAGIFDVIEKSSMPVGLYYQSGLVYLLGRQTHQGSTTWTLYAMDPTNEELASKFLLPTRANHVEVMPNEGRWLVLEKGRVKGWGDQDIETMLSLPDAWLEPGESPIELPNPSVQNCKLGSQ